MDNYRWKLGSFKGFIYIYKKLLLVVVFMWYLSILFNASELHLDYSEDVLIKKWSQLAMCHQYSTITMMMNDPNFVRTHCALSIFGPFPSKLLQETCGWLVAQKLDLTFPKRCCWMYSMPLLLTLPSMMGTRTHPRRCRPPTRSELSLTTHNRHWSLVGLWVTRDPVIVSSSLSLN